MFLEFKSIDLRAGAPAGSQLLTAGAVADGSGMLRPLGASGAATACLAGEWAQAHPVCRHRLATGAENLIFALPAAAGGDSTRLAYLVLPEGRFPAGEVSPREFATVGARVTSGAASAGSIAVLASSGGLVYIRWRDDARGYDLLGFSVPEINPEFRLVREEFATGGGSLSIALESAEQAELLAGRLGATGLLSLSAEGSQAALVARLTDEVYASLYSLTSSATADNRFCEPFMVRAGLRMADGSFVALTSPQLMLPTGFSAPLLGAERVKVDRSALTFSADVTAEMLARCRLEMRIVGFDEERFEPWRDLIDALVVGVTLPFATYDQSAPVTGVTTLRRAVAGSGSLRPGATNDTEADGTTNGSDAASATIRGIYADNAAAAVEEHRFSDDESARAVWRLPRADASRFEEALTTAGRFHIVAELAPDSWSGFSGQFAEVAMARGALSALAARPLLPDGYAARDRHVAVGEMLPSTAPLLFFNGRLTVASSATIVAAPTVPRALLPFLSAGESVRVGVRVRLRRDGEMVEAALAPGALSAIQWPGAATTPRWIFYPDPDAVELRLVEERAAGEGGVRRVVSFPLTRHQSLNGAYYYGGLAAGLEAASTTESAAEPLATVEPTVAAIPTLMSTDVGRPFLFPATGRVALPGGRPMALVAATAAMSAGQFGSFPLYFFTDSGVGVVDATAQGGWCSPRMLTDAAPLSAAGILPVGGGALFVTPRGVMRLSGATLTRLDAAVDAAGAAVAADLSADRFETIGSRVLEAVAAEDGTLFRAIASVFPLRRGVATRLAADRAAGIVYLYRPGESRAVAALHLPSGSWGIALGRRPWEWAIEAGGILIAADSQGAISSVDANSGSGVILTATREFAPSGGAVKRVELWPPQSGPEARRCAVALLGSNDLTHWFPVAAIRGTRTDLLTGTRYACYRAIAAATHPLQGLRLT